MRHYFKSQVYPGKRSHSEDLTIQMWGSTWYVIVSSYIGTDTFARGYTCRRHTVSPQRVALLQYEVEQPTNNSEGPRSHTSKLILVSR